MMLAMMTACGSGAGDASTMEGGSSGGSSGGGSTGSTGEVVTGGDASSSGDGTESGGIEVDPRVADCLRINACEVDGGTPMGLQACMRHVLEVPWSWATVGPQQALLAAMACKLAAPDCVGVRACTPAVEGFAGACADAPGSDLCVGDTWVFCDELGAPTLAMDCAAAGEKCNRDIWAGCGVEPCKFGETEAQCDGDSLVECSPAGLMVRIDCPTQYNVVYVNGKDGEMVYSIAGETCGFDEQRNALGCVGTGDACDFFSQACDGAVLETCAGGKLGHRDCAAIDPPGQGCGFVQSGQFAGAAACGLLPSACDLGADESCVDGVLGYCNWGQPASLDCAAAGYGGCASAVQGDRTIAYCTQ